MGDLVEELAEVVGGDHVLTGTAVHDDYTHDEALTATPVVPLALVRPGCTAEVAGVLRVAEKNRTPVIARGSGTGLSGASVPRPDGILVSFERMNEILEIDTDNHVAVVQPGVTLEELDRVTAGHGLVYPVFPGESSASLGGNVATNAGGMRAIKYGVTRHQVLALEAVLATGEVIRTGGKFVKSSTGYDLTQLIVGSEGTLALVTEATLKLHPRAAHSATVLVPFATLEEVTLAVPPIVSSGAGPVILEYIDVLTMAAITANVGLDLGIPKEVKESAAAYLVVVLENGREDRLDEDIATLADLLVGLGAMEVYVLPAQAAGQLISAREKAFFVAKAHGADDIIDVVVPRAAIPAFLATASEVADAHATLVTGCGHVGDGNVHLSVFQPDEGRRADVLRAIFRAGMELGGAISGEHGIGTEKKKFFQELEDPTKVALMRRIKGAFDPHGILGPDILFDR
ncbi:MAG TPA: FAD-binding oxidoreductase [Acidimicrobiales bacterium]|nr:FAD-binding oxidoreductase [Acidimicrobiales bacterium]